MDPKIKQAIKIRKIDVFIEKLKILEKVMLNDGDDYVRFYSERLKELLVWILK